MKQINLVIGCLIFSLLVFTGCTTAVKSNENVEKLSTADRLANLDPQKVLVGTEMGDYHFQDSINKNQVHIDELFQDKVLIIQSFSNGCPACVDGISEYAELYEKYEGRIEILYMDINHNEDADVVREVKETYGGGNWIWTHYQGSLLPFYEEYNFNVNDMTIIVDKGGRIAYADSFAYGLPKIEAELGKLGV
jgi:thiol-disulfide isomerase/thioredoxin